MAIAPGNRFQLTDLQALATQANAISSVNFDLTEFFWVCNPMNFVPSDVDPTTPAYGLRVLGAFTLTAGGTGYAVGDTVGIGVTEFEVTLVDPNGEIIGLLTLTNPGYAPGGNSTSSPLWPLFNDPSPGALTNISSSGTGATITFTIAQYGPNAAFSYPDYTPGNGIFTGFYLCYGGTGYHAGDSLTVPGAQVSGGGALPVTVSTVDGSGKILTFSLPNTSFNVWTITLPTNPQAMPCTGGFGTGATFGGLFILPARPTWLAELNRNRAALWNLLSVDETTTFMQDISPAALCVSGPWPVAGPTDNYASTWFYFADTGSGATITVASEFYGAGPFSCGVRTNAVCSMLLSTFPLSPYYYPVTTKQRQAFVVGGVDSLFVSGTFHILAEYVRGGTAVITYPGPTTTITPDTVDPNTLWSVNLSPSGGYNAFPGSVSYSTYVADTGFCSIGIVEISIAVSATLAPGRYELEVDIPQLPDDTSVPITGTQTTYTRLFPNSSSPLGDGSGGNGKLFGPVTASINYSTAVATAGIHNSLPVKKIQLPGDGLSHGPGLLYVQNLPNDYWNVPDVPGGSTFSTPITYNPEKIFGNGWGISETVAGFWTAMSPAISSQNLAVETSMPWNLPRHQYAPSGTVLVNPMLIGDQAPNTGSGGSAVAHVSNSYNQGNPVEQQMEPPSWAASTYFSGGFTIIDSNGYLQTVFTAGVSGGSAPGWSSTLGGSTTDGGVVWHCSKLFPAPATTWVASTVYQSGAIVIDSNGNIQTAQATGTSGGSAPSWSGTLGGSTTDNTLTWKLTARWQTIKPAKHRQPNIPRYPFYWYSETITRLLPPTNVSGNTIWGAYDQWQPNYYNGSSHDNGWQKIDNSDTAPSKGMAYGWFIYKVAVNRIASTAGTVAVTVGCMRSGSFVSFATFNTGTINQVLWPIFTSDALVYQCTERVDIQALAIAGPVPTGQTVSKPMCAAFVTDTAALMALIT
jgi:hypothetical protein